MFLLLGAGPPTAMFIFTYPGCSLWRESVTLHKSSGVEKKIISDLQQYMQESKNKNIPIQEFEFV